MMSIPILFDEVLLNPAIFSRAEGYSPLTGWPEFANTVVRNERTGVCKTNVNRFDAIEMLSVDLVLMAATDRPYFINFWRGGYGSGVGFRCKVPWDYTGQGQALGTIGTSTTATFYLTKTYTRTGVTARQDVRRIVKPVVNVNLASGCPTLYEADGATLRAQDVPFVVRVGGATTGFTYTIDNRTGVLVVTTTTASGIVTCDFTFDIPAAFVGNTISHKNSINKLSRAQGVLIREILPAELGILL